MSKKCPPGVICIENVSMFFIILVFIIVSYLIYLAVSKSNQVNVNNNHKIVIQDKQNERPNGGFFNLFPQQMLPADVLMDPYVPPLRDERYLVPGLTIVPPGRVPINISTNRGAVDTTYRQVGILTPLNKNSQDKNSHDKNNDSHEKILPLMGRPLFTNRDMWQYYSMSDQNNSVKLPIRFKGRNASNEYGVDKIYNRDIVFVEGYQRAFMVTEYENDTIKYLPFL